MASLSRFAGSPVPAFLPSCLLARLRTSLGGRAVLECVSEDELIAAASVACTCVVIDPVLCGPGDEPSRGLSDALGAGRPIVLYTHPSPASIRRCFAWARGGAGHLLLAGVDDDEVRLRAVFGSLLDALGAEALVKLLDERLALVPDHLAVAVRRLFLEPGTVLDLAALVASTHMTQRSVDRWLRRAELAPPKHLLGAARLLRVHRELARGDANLGRAAHRAGFRSERSLKLTSRVLLGLPPSALRALRADELHGRVARKLCKS